MLGRAADPGRARHRDGPARARRHDAGPCGIGPGDCVSLHWDGVCDKLTRRQLCSLRMYTMRHLDVVNHRVERPARRHAGLSGAPGTHELPAAAGARSVRAMPNTVDGGHMGPAGGGSGPGLATAAGGALCCWLATAAADL